MGLTVSVIRTSTGQKHKVKVRSSNSVHDLKIRLQVQTGIPIEHMRIIFEDKTLEEESILSECEIQSKSVLYLTETGLTFTVKTEMGTEHEVHMDSLDLVKTLKLILQEITKYPVERQKLMFNGRQLEDDHPLSAYEIQQASVVYMMIHKNNDVVVIVKQIGWDKRWFIDLNLCDTVKNLKAKIQDHSSIPTDKIRFEGEELEDERTVSDCGIKHLSIVEVIWDFKVICVRCCASETEEEEEEKEDKDVGEKRGKSISMDNLADFNHQKPRWC